MPYVLGEEGYMSHIEVFLVGYDVRSLIAVMPSSFLPYRLVVLISEYFIIAS
jgi:hypothetical protein